MSDCLFDLCILNMQLKYLGTQLRSLMKEKHHLLTTNLQFYRFQKVIRTLKRIKSEHIILFKALPNNHFKILQMLLILLLPHTLFYLHQKRSQQLKQIRLVFNRHKRLSCFRLPYHLLKHLIQLRAESANHTFDLLHKPHKVLTRLGC